MPVLWPQLAGSGVTEDMFSLCFGSIEGDGALLLGNVLVPPYTQQLRYTPMVQDPSNQFYMTALEQVAVGNTTLPFDQASPAVSSAVEVTGLMIGLQLAVCAGICKSQPTSECARPAGTSTSQLSGS